jgi:hypothetical protein
MKDVDGKFIDWLKSTEASSYSDFIQKNFSLSEKDLEKLTEKENLKKKRKKRKK